MPLLNALPPAVVQRWTRGLAPDDLSDAEISRLETQRQRNLRTIRQGIESTDQEFKLIRYLMRTPGRIRTYLEMARHLWQTPTHRITERMLAPSGDGYNAPMVTTIQVLVHQIRYKLEVDPLRPQHLANVRGVGYVWYDDAPSLDDGINYEARAELMHRMRAQLRYDFGFDLTDDELSLVAHRRPQLGPDHPDVIDVTPET